MNYFYCYCLLFFTFLLTSNTNGEVASCYVGVGDELQEVYCSVSGASKARYCSKLVLSSPSFGLDYTIRSCVVEVTLHFCSQINSYFFLIYSFFSFTFSVLQK